MAPQIDDDFIFTISDHDDVSDEEETEAPAKLSGQGKKRKYEEEDVVSTTASQKKTKVGKGKHSKKVSVHEEEPQEQDEDKDIDSDFEFQVGDASAGLVDDFDAWDNGNAPAQDKDAVKKGAAVDIDELIGRRRSKAAIVAESDDKDDEDEDEDEEKSEEEWGGFGEEDELLAEDGFGMGAESEDDDSSSEGSDVEGEQDEEQEEDESDDDSVAAPVPHPMDLENPESEDESEGEDQAEAKKAASFFAPEEKALTKKTTGNSFQHLKLSRPILKGIASVGWTEPTPIQQKSIPIAMSGKDLVGGAETGSGKTGAFLIPILERLLYRPKKVATTRVAIFMPTRELAVQCFNVTKKLTAFTDITSTLMAGGFSSREQEAQLKKRPDIVIATPGRFIDHMLNSSGFHVELLEILVLDEADRMLEEGFESQLNEILTTIPKSRQTMLFSATMTSSVDKLISIGMNRPVRLMVDQKKQTVAGLVQEVIRLREGKESKRLAYLMYLCKEIYTKHVIIFFRQKKEAHRARVIFLLCGLQASELHGNMSQEQRIQAVEAFRSGKSSYLLATDVASRGLDIKNVSTVLNYEAPQTHEIYLHRVGRTARAGRTGHACTIAAEPDRKVMKAVARTAAAQNASIQMRHVPPEEIEKWTQKLSELETEIEEVLQEEKEERAMSVTERDLKRGENLITHEEEIKSRPKKTWFESEKDKAAAKEKGRPGATGAGAGDEAGKKKKKKLSGKDRKKLELKDIRREGGVWKKGKDARDARPTRGKDGKGGGKGKNSSKGAGKAGKGKGRS